MKEKGGLECRGIDTALILSQFSELIVAVKAIRVVCKVEYLKQLYLHQLFVFLYTVRKIITHRHLCEAKNAEPKLLQ